MRRHRCHRPQQFLDRLEPCIDLIHLLAQMMDLVLHLVDGLLLLLVGSDLRIRFGAGTGRGRRFGRRRNHRRRRVGRPINHAVEIGSGKACKDYPERGEKLRNQITHATRPLLHEHRFAASLPRVTTPPTYAEPRRQATALSKSHRARQSNSLTHVPRAPLRMSCALLRRRPARNALFRTAGQFCAGLTINQEQPVMAWQTALH